MNRILSIGLAVLAVLAGCKETHDGHEHGAVSASKGASKAWHCPMHPQVIRNQPSNCPLCGMDLVEFSPSEDGQKKDSAPTDSYRGAGPTVTVGAAVLQKIGVRTDLVDNGVVGRRWTVDAEGVLDQAAERSVTVRTMGYLEAVGAFREGDAVSRGQTLVQFYAPELVTAQGDWLAARAMGDSLQAGISRERLLSLGVSQDLLGEIAREGKPRRAIPLVSPASGWIRVRSAVQGQSAMAGQELFRIVEGTGVVLEARIPQGSAAVAPGDPVELSGPGIGKVASKVVSVVPQLDRATRSMVVRLSPPRGTAIRPGTQVRAAFVSAKESGMVVPSDAVLHSGRRDVVFVALGGGRFRPVEVELGPSADGKVLVRSGLEIGDEVVVAAQFLLDGESRLQSALDQLGAGAQP